MRDRSLLGKPGLGLATGDPAAVRRRSLFSKVGLGLATGVAAAIPQSARAEPAIRWRMQASWPKSLDTLFSGPELIARRVAELTDGKFEIRVFAAGEVVPPLQVLDAVGAETVELGHTAPYYFVGKDPAFAFGTSVCFGMNTRQQTAWWLHGGGAEAMAPLFKDYGCVALLGGNTGAQMGGWFRKEIRSVEDLKGLKFRIAGMAGQILARLGVVPQQIAGSDIYPGLERGTIDAAEWVGPYDDEKLGLNKVAKYYYYPGFWEGNAMLVTLVNEKAWNGLPKAYQAALQTASAEACVSMVAKYDAQNPDALKRLVAKGTVLKPFPRDVLVEIEKATYEVFDELSKKSEHFKRIYPQWRKFRDDQVLWFRFAEQSYDTFISQSKFTRSQPK